MAKVLILGGTAEAAELAARLAGDDRLETVTSLAGLTRLPNQPAGHVRRGGFGGPDGLAALLKADGYAALIDATHPFAAQIAEHAAEAADKARVPRLKLVRPPFERTDDTRFIPVRSMAEAAEQVPAGARVFLAAGRRELAPFAKRKDIWCLLRMIEPPAPGEALPAGELILGRPAADPETEMALLREHRIDWIVSKDSGGRAGAKIEAARRLAIPVVLVERPEPPAGETVPDVEACLEWLEGVLAQAPAEPAPG
ncbi:cobalt-precorrin-6A reductase [Propylenella binzhouense]|uniref:Cobalt-precorrin-6A reductase n=1 Tax=Propylenella binzhouense TaxID=2555902 RepID=A0A964TAB2_9HYPH|nr:cobalt-precorrin-6A reductase [Propylenella binzhouense]MYZ50202.1 cobalt-precorrin-6A reductase [Propylenella binzhouense]